jgi:hypothetical protein
MHRSSRWPRLLAGVALVLAACSSSPSPSPSGAPSPSDNPSASGAPSTSAQPVVEGKPTSTDLIRAAVRNGTLDEATGLLYRLYAQVFDPRLPEAFRGEAAEDHAVADAAEAAWPDLSTDEQAALLPFLVRPTDAASIFQEANATASRGNQLALVTVDPRCGANARTWPSRSPSGVGARPMAPATCPTHSTLRSPSSRAS